MSDQDEDTHEPEIDHPEPAAGIVMEAAPRTGPPWEATGPTGPRFIETVKQVLLSPTALFRNMRREGGYGGPLTFGVLGSTIGFAIGMLMQLAIALLTPGQGAMNRPVIGVFALMFLLFLPFLLGLSLLIWAALYHLVLRMLGAARYPFETTFRVVAYAFGSTSLLQIFPVCGGLIGFIDSIVVSIIGLTQTHGVSTAKATIAVLVPMLILTLLAFMALAAAISTHTGALPGLSQAL